MKPKITPAGQTRINQMISTLDHKFSSEMVAMLKDVNQVHLKNKGQVTAAPNVDQSGLQWRLSWKQDQISFEVTVAVMVVDNGTQAQIDRVWVHRHVTTPFDYDGNTPSTRMHRLTSLAIPAIRAAIEREFA